MPSCACTNILIQDDADKAVMTHKIKYKCAVIYFSVIIFVHVLPSFYLFCESTYRFLPALLRGYFLLFNIESEITLNYRKE